MDSLARSTMGAATRVGVDALSGQKRFNRGGRYRRQRLHGRGVKFSSFQSPRWDYSLDNKVRSDEWKRRALRNHFPEVWVRNTNWVPSLETYTVDPEYHWEYYQQAHRQRLYNHPEDYTHFIDEVLEHVELRPQVWVPRCLRVFEDLRERFGVSQRQYTTLIQVYSRARLLGKAEETFKKIGEEKLPYNKENYLALSRAYILSRHVITEDEAVAKVKALFDEATAKGILMPEYVTGVNFAGYYDALKRLGSELDHKIAKEKHDKGEGPLQREAWEADVKTLWHNIKPRARIPREFSLLGHPLNRHESMIIDWKGVKKGQAVLHQSWLKYGYPSQIRWIEKWQEYRNEGKWKEWDGKAWAASQEPPLPTDAGYADAHWR